MNVYCHSSLGKHSSYKLKSEYSVEKLEQKKILNNDLPLDAEQDEHCEVIHIGSVCSGFSATLNFHTLLKSLYFYRINPIHFHIITNKVSENILRTLFDSWDVPQGMYPFNIIFIQMSLLLNVIELLFCLKLVSTSKVCFLFIFVYFNFGEILAFHLSVKKFS